MAEGGLTCPIPTEAVLGPFVSPKGLEFTFSRYSDERQLEAIVALISRELSEPYSLFTYRHFLSGWPELTFLVSARRPWLRCTRGQQR